MSRRTTEPTARQRVLQQIDALPEVLAWRQCVADIEAADEAAARVARRAQAPDASVVEVHQLRQERAALIDTAEMTPDGGPADTSAIDARIAELQSAAESASRAAAEDRATADRLKARADALRGTKHGLMLAALKAAQPVLIASFEVERAAYVDSLRALRQQAARLNKLGTAMSVVGERINGNPGAHATFAWWILREEVKVVAPSPRDGFALQPLETVAVEAEIDDLVTLADLCEALPIGDGSALSGALYELDRPRKVPEPLPVRIVTAGPVVVGQWRPDAMSEVRVGA